MCGIIGMFSTQDVQQDIYNGLIHLQHRGQDAAGMLTYDTKFHLVKGKGFVKEVFNEENIVSLTGNWGLGHTRYPTTGSAYDSANAQPFTSNYPYGIAMVHNGNLTNYEEVKQQLAQDEKFYCNSGSDLEVILGFFSLSLADTKNDGKPLMKNLIEATNSVYDTVRGGYSVVGLIADRGMIAFRDPHGIRPLVMGRRESDEGGFDYIFASETGMFNSLGFEYFDDVQPGELIYISKEGNLERRILRKKQFAPCAFEYVYFARPDAFINHVSVYRARQRMGQNLAKKWKKLYPNVMPDVVIPVPFSANVAALSLANELGIRYTEGLYKNPYVGRTFIMANQSTRKKSIYRKLTPQPLEIRDKNVLVVDDSIVRGTTSRAIVDMLREAGAQEIYFVSASPEIKYPDFYGIDIADPDELIASKMSVEEIRKEINADLLMYQDIEGLFEAITRKGDHCIDRLSMPWFDGWYVTEDIGADRKYSKTSPQTDYQKLLSQISLETKSRETEVETEIDQVSTE
jgi:amidophosphoribosyltransferase